jgi:hypothetical protein
VDYEFLRRLFAPEFISRWDQSRSKEAMKLGNFLLFSYAERLNGNLVSKTENLFDNWHSFLVAIQILTDKDKAIIEDKDDIIYSELMYEVRQELSFFVNGVDFETELLPEIYGLLNPDHVLPEEFCFHCLTPDEFRIEFDLFSNWRSGKFTGIQDTQILDALAISWGNLDGVFGYVLANNPYCSVELLTKLLSSNYKEPFYLDSKETKTRAEFNLKIKDHRYFQK